MSIPRRFQERSFAALRAGELKIDTPPYDGGPRYGISAVLRPSEPIVAELEARSVERHEAGFVRDLWYLSLIQFAAPVRDVAGLLAWGEANRDRTVGTVVYRTVEILRWHLDGATLKSETLHVSELDG